MSDVLVMLFVKGYRQSNLSKARGSQQKGGLMQHNITILLLLLSMSSTAGQAPWYQWQSKTTGGLICAQHSPGDGWVQHAAPFRTAGHCKQALPQNRKKP